MTKPDADESVMVGVDRGRPGGDKSVEVTARRTSDGGVEILSMRELPQAGSSVQCSVRDCPIHRRPPASELVSYEKSGGVRIDLKRWLRWFLPRRAK